MADVRGQEVTLAELAAHLGVRTPSLYNHIAGQEGLRRELARLGGRELAARLGRAAIGKAADEAILAVASAYRTFAKEHPGLYAASLRAPAPADTAHLAISEEILAILYAVLDAYGLRDEAAVHAIRGLRSVLHGFVSLELAGGFGMPLDLDERYTRRCACISAVSGSPRADLGCIHRQRAHTASQPRTRPSVDDQWSSWISFHGR